MPENGRRDLIRRLKFNIHSIIQWPPLWSSGQSFWLQIQRSRVRFPALPDFLSSSGSGTGSTQPREVNWGATWIKSSGSGLENRDWTAVGNRCADHVTPLYLQKLVLTSSTGSGRSVGIVRSRIKATEFSLVYMALAPKPAAAAFTSKSKEIIDKWEYSNYSNSPETW